MYVTKDLGADLFGLPSRENILMSMSAPATDRPKASTVSRILEAAAELFVARSYADVTVDKVAEAAELTKGAVYHHFNSKEQLYLAMLHADLADKRSLFESAQRVSGSSRERLRALTASFLALPETKRQLIQLVRRDANMLSDPLRAELVRAYQHALPDPVEAILRDGIRDGEIIPADPRLLAWQYIAAMEVLLTPYADQRFGCDDDKLSYVISTFFYGCIRARAELTSSARETTAGPTGEK